MEAYSADAVVLFAQEVTLDLEPIVLPSTIEVKPATLIATMPFITIA
jgi:hypothetical protein